MPYVLDPSVAGELGARTELDTSTHPPGVTAVEYLLDSPDGDDLIQSFPVFLVSSRLGKALIDASLSGVDLGPVVVGRSGPFMDVYGDAAVPPYDWLRPGRSQDDIAIGEELELVVSDRAWDVIRNFQLVDCLVSDCEC